MGIVVVCCGSAVAVGDLLRRQCVRVIRLPLSAVHTLPIRCQRSRCGGGDCRRARGRDKNGEGRITRHATGEGTEAAQSGGRGAGGRGGWARTQPVMIRREGERAFVRLGSRWSTLPAACQHGALRRAPLFPPRPPLVASLGSIRALLVPSLASIHRCASLQ